ncbi:MAG TPA: uroporphyrinogen-III C-methyltransferase [Vicinamibacterales bacterium]|nr:uroporphyrinogen-III C-methyltransferase [Vicinamibacterales bacterium]
MPLFLTLDGRDVVLVGGGRVATAKLQALLAAGARVRVVAPSVTSDIEQRGVEIVRRGFVPSDLDGAWLVVAAATPAVNRDVAAAAEPRRIFVNAVDDPANASAFLSGIVRREGVTIGISTSGEAPALTALVREALEALLPDDLDRWMAEARRQRTVWRRDRVPMSARKPRLLEALNELYDGATGNKFSSGPIASAAEAIPARPRQPGRIGHVSLVGAGPGDPALLTRKAIARLRAADLVLYDALIDDRMLRYARKAQRFFAGKRAGRSGGQSAPRRIEAMTQRTIHSVMIRAARRGRQVVRLKGGDPFVFGRGGEEMRALLQAGVPFDVVPGVTSAIAAPALAGIPVTYRGVSTAVLVTSGHDAETLASSLCAVKANGVTLVVMMGGTRATAIAESLLDLGWPGETPAAIVVNASASDQQVWRGTLGTLSNEGSWNPAALPGPATIIVGDVVALAAVKNESAEIERRYVTGA